MMKKFMMFLMFAVFAAIASAGCAGAKRVVYSAMPTASVNSNLPFFHSTSISVINNFPGGSDYVIYIEVNGGLAMKDNSPLQILPGGSAKVNLRNYNTYGAQHLVVAKAYRGGKYVGKSARTFYSGNYSQNYEFPVSGNNIDWAR